MRAEPPLAPDPDAARDLLQRELSRPQYAEAQPNWFDRAAQAVGDWLAGLRLPDGSGSPWALVVIVVAIAIVLLVAYVVFGPPRRSRRRAMPGALFGADDVRTADQLRASSAGAAASGDLAVAIEERFRAIARGLHERALVTTSPGTTAHGFSAQASGAFPALAEPFAGAADDFDHVRYLGGIGSADAYERMVALDTACQAARPLLEATS